MILDARRAPHQWFAWHPVRVGFGRKAWLQYVWRMHDSQQWTYRLTADDFKGGGHGCA